MLEGNNKLIDCQAIFPTYSVADRDLDLRGGAWFVLLSLPAFLPFTVFCFPQNNVGPRSLPV